MSVANKIMIHEPVLLETILYYFSPNSGDNFIDATAGEGGHTIPLAQKIAPQGRVLAVDRDPSQIQNLKKIAPKNVIVQHGNFGQLKEIAVRNSFYAPKGILFDLGFSSWHIEQSGRGFSFQKNEPLDMRFDYTDKSILTARELVNTASEKKLESILTEYGEEKFAERIVKEILKTRSREKIETTGDLVNIVAKVKNFGGRINPATRTFQALRMAVNNELANIQEGINCAMDILLPQGMVAVITFHSLEDRLVKNLFKLKEAEGVGKRVNKKVIRPDYKEAMRNPRSRSAKLRIFSKYNEM